MFTSTPPPSFDPEQAGQDIIQFIRKTFQDQGKTVAVVAVSGGVDSGTTLTLAAQALGSGKVYPLFLPFGPQSDQDGRSLAAMNDIPEANWQTFRIDPIVEAAQSSLNISHKEKLRLGNVMARARMIIVYDTAKSLNALVCGTENKSEKYLGYFTRFGDEASDLEPLQHLYKTQIRRLAQHMSLPQKIVEKAPSAGLWQGQNDQDELGFSYDDADVVLAEYIDGNLQDQGPVPLTITSIAEKTGVKEATVQAVINQVEAMKYKHLVPYKM